MYDLGFIDINYALGIQTIFTDKFDVFKIPITDKNRVVIELYKDGIMKDKDGNLIDEQVGDLHRCGYWLEKQKMGSFICKGCGREIAHYNTTKQEKKRRYCKECLSKTKVDTEERKCIDCGKAIPILNGFDRSTCRCSVCQKKENAKNNKVARLKYKNKKQNEEKS